MDIVSAQCGGVQEQQQLLFIRTHYFLAFLVDFPVMTALIIYPTRDGSTEMMKQPKGQNIINTSRSSSCPATGGIWSTTV